MGLIEVTMYGYECDECSEHIVEPEYDNEYDADDQLGYSEHITLDNGNLICIYCMDSYHFCEWCDTHTHSDEAIYCDSMEQYFCDNCVEEAHLHTWDAEHEAPAINQTCEECDTTFGLSLSEMSYNANNPLIKREKANE